MDRFASFLSNPFRGRSSSPEDSNGKKAKKRPLQQNAVPQVSPGTSDPMDIDDYEMITTSEVEDVSRYAQGLSPLEHRTKSSHQAGQPSTDSDATMVDRVRDEPLLIEEPSPQPPPSPQPRFLELNLPQDDDGDFFHIDPSVAEETPGPNASPLSIWPLSTPLQTEIHEVARSSPAPARETARRPLWEATGRQFWFEVMGPYDDVKFDRLYEIRCSIKALLGSSTLEWIQLDLYLLAACRDDYIPEAERAYIEELLERRPAVKELLEELFSLLHIARPSHIPSSGHAGNELDPYFLRFLRKTSNGSQGHLEYVRTMHRQDSFERLASSRTGPSERPRLRRGIPM